MCKVGVHRKAACMPSTSGLPVLEGSQQTTQVRATAACHRTGGLSVLKAASSPTVHFTQPQASGKLCAHHKGSANECQWHIGRQQARRGLSALCFAHQPNCPVKGTPIRQRALRSPSGRPLPLALDPREYTACAGLLDEGSAAHASTCQRQMGRLSFGSRAHHRAPRVECLARLLRRLKVR